MRFPHSTLYEKTDDVFCRKNWTLSLSLKETWVDTVDFILFKNKIVALERLDLNTKKTTYLVYHHRFSEPNDEVDEEQGQKLSYYHWSTYIFDTFEALTEYLDHVCPGQGLDFKIFLIQKRNWVSYFVKTYMAEDGKMFDLVSHQISGSIAYLFGRAEYCEQPTNHDWFLIADHLYVILSDGSQTIDTMGKIPLSKYMTDVQRYRVDGPGSFSSVVLIDSSKLTPCTIFCSVLIWIVIYPIFLVARIVLTILNPLTKVVDYAGTKIFGLFLHKTTTIESKRLLFFYTLCTFPFAILFLGLAVISACFHFIIKIAECPKSYAMNLLKNDYNIEIK